jgi:hypothetical protein
VTTYIRALRRFWWILVLGLLLAMVAAVTSVYTISLGLPPKAVKRESPMYTASTRLLVTSQEVPYFRTVVTRIEAGPQASARRSGSTEDVPAATPVITSGPPDTNTLVQAANLYPVLIESDQVRRLRDRLYGPIPGLVTARAIFAFATPNRFEFSPVPVIEVFANAATPDDARLLAQRTFDAFNRWITAQQDRKGLRGNERILVQQLRRPDGVIPAGGSSLAMPMLLALALLVGFAGLAILLDRMFPSQREQAETVIERLERRLMAEDRA